ncbi:MAG: cyclic nucleotide-binding domain-containing protein, partial [Kiritimatiellae bacterium]|nr:cyclic nucleotide-binding domain-containing protein [Kiritimatiellia bacterium]
METYIHLRLKKCDFFGSLPDEDLARLAKMAFVRELAKGESLFHEGQACTALYCLDMGRIHIVRSVENGGEVIIRTVR